MRYYNLLTLALSFSLSTVAFLAAQPDDVPVQELVFDDYVIEGYVDVIEFDEVVIVSQVDPSDDGDGENIDMMNENWCLIHPDDVICQDEDQGGDDEEGC